ncbi:MAG: recombinase family protein, partial [Alcanivoracaceae bacterium]|nr:recombinase family protein [Alcanivoracaceae bacterium]
VQGPLVREAFELYSTNNYSLLSLNKVMHKRGLRSSVGGNLGKNGFSRILNNPFYYGTIYIQASKETYAGKHEPLITKALYNRVQDILTGKTRKKINKHSFAYRRIFKCHNCHYSLIGEYQKGNVYYRCHTPSCEMKTIRETKLITMIDKVLGGIQLTEKTFLALSRALEEKKSKSAELKQTQLETSKLQLANAKSRLERLLNLFIDGKINQTAFDAKQQSLQDEVSNFEHQLSHSNTHIEQILAYVEKFLELAESLILGYQTAPDDMRGDLLKSITLNPTISPIHIDIPVDLPWSLFVNTSCVPSCGDARDRPRTEEISKKELEPWVKGVMAELIKYFSDPTSKYWHVNISNRYIPPPTKPK